MNVPVWARVASVSVSRIPGFRNGFAASGPCSTAGCPGPAPLCAPTLRGVRLAVAAAGALAFLSAPAFANADRWRLEPYAGGSVGVTRDSSSAAFNAGSTVTREATSAFGGQVFAGLKLGPWFGIELTRLQLGELGREVQTPGGPVDTVRAIGVTALGVAGFLPLRERWELIGRAGIAMDASYATGQTCYQRTGRTDYYSGYPCQSTSYLLGAGVRYAMNDDWGLRGDFLYLDFQDSRQGPAYRPYFLGIGVDYRF